MKILVDKLTENCFECPLARHRGGPERIECRLTDGGYTGTRGKASFCPLMSIGEYLENLTKRHITTKEYLKSVKDEDLKALGYNDEEIKRLRGQD